MKNYLIASLLALVTLSANCATENLDFGDAPPPYPTRLPEDGARHRVGSLCFGASVDGESDGWPSSDCIGDDVRGTADDEDGVEFGPLMSGKRAHVTIVVSAPGRVDAWADFNRDGAWASSERFLSNQPVIGGTNRFEFTVPTGMAGGYVYVRLRLSSAGGLAPTGFAEDGEVQDYRVYVRQALGWQPHLTIGSRGQNVALNWQVPEAVLQQADSLGGPWTSLPDAASPHVLSAASENKFYRLRLRTERGFEAMVREADVIFDGVVTSVVYRDSSVEQTHPKSWPHTFVTFRVEQVLKGRLESQDITLRFLGGRSENAETSLRMSHSPTFDVGERTILFVHRNGEWATPLMPGPNRCLRVMDGMMVSEDGHEVLWTEEATVAFGERQASSQVASNAVGNTATQQTDDQSQPEAGPTPLPVQARPMSRDQFAAFLTELIPLVHTPAELASLPVALSMDPNTPYFVSYAQPASPKLPVRPTRLPGTAPSLERLLYEANGRNPVLP